ncbi:MAG: hypothetical protein ACFFDP_05490 [Promethearchaeota archaeon]
MIIISEKVHISVDDVLKGKIDVESLSSRYVFLYARGVRNVFEKLAEALNYMAKFGWRVRGITSYTFLLEREE